jgi:hypothetical protein
MANLTPFAPDIVPASWMMNLRLFDLAVDPLVQIPDSHRRGPVSDQDSKQP